MLHTPTRARSRHPQLGGLLLVGLAAALIFAAAWHYDTDIFRATFPGPERRNVIITRDWYQFLRGVGFLPTWLAIGGAIILAGGHKRASRAGALLIASPAIAGGLAELLKPIVARYRPEFAEGVHKYHVSTDPSSGPYGFASSHAAVAFGAAFMLLFVYPRAGVLALLLAAGCAWTRILSGAHFASDVVAGIVIGYACARLLRPLPGRTGGGGGGSAT